MANPGVSLTHRILVTGLKDEDSKNDLIEKIVKLGGQYLDSNVSLVSFTFLMAPWMFLGFSFGFYSCDCFSVDSLREGSWVCTVWYRYCLHRYIRTVLLTGKWLLRPDYVRDSSEEGSWLPEDKYVFDEEEQGPKEKASEKLA